MSKPHQVAVLIASQSNLGECVAGLRLLGEAAANGQIELCEVPRVLTLKKSADGQSRLNVIGVASMHRNMTTVLDLLTAWYNQGKQRPDVIITGAGLANHLSGCTDAFLRYILGDTQVTVIAVAFTDKKRDPDGRVASQATSFVPGTETIWKDPDTGQELIGSEGFRRACILAIEGNFPEINAPKPREPKALTLEEAIVIGQAQNQEN